MSDDARQELARLRSEIEQVDRALIELIARRMELGRQVGNAKRAAGLPALDPAR
jgi:chorismate mutase